MYQIVAEQTSAVNGLGAGGEWLANGGGQLISDILQTATSITNTAINAKNNQNPNPNTGQNTYTPTIYQPPTVQTTTGGDNKTDWTPWIIGGAIVFAGIYLITKK